MGKKKAALAARAWELLRLALLWTRKGGAFRRGLFSEASRGDVPKLLWGLGGNGGNQGGYGEKKLSCGETPVSRQGSVRSVRRQRPMRLVFSSIPCVNPPLPTELVFDDNDEYAKSDKEVLPRRSNGEVNDEVGVVEELASAALMEGTEEAGDDEEKFVSLDWALEHQEAVDEEEEFVSLDWAPEHQEAGEEDEDGVDARAEKFIARFYQQMKLQRQVSLLQYHEMLHRGT